MADIQLSGSVSTTGTAILGRAAVAFASDADHALSVPEYTNLFLKVTSGVTLTATRNLVAPLVEGQNFQIQNNTTGGQAIQIIGTSGTGIAIANGATVSVVCDGTNYLAIGGGTFADDLAGSTPTNQWIAAITGPAGVPGPVPVNPAASLVLGGNDGGSGLGDPTFGILRIRDNGLAAGQDIVTWRDASVGADRVFIGIGPAFGQPTIGDGSFPVRYRSDANRLSGTTDSANDPRFSASVFVLELEANPVATFFEEGWSVMWEQGTAQVKDGKVSRFNYWNTNSILTSVVAQIVLPPPLFDSPCDTLVVKLKVQLLGWEVDSPTGEFATFDMFVTFAVHKGTPLVILPPTIGLNGIAPVDTGHSTSGVGVNPSFVDLSDGFLSVQVTSWTANQTRWQCFAEYAVISDAGDDLAPLPVW